MRTHLLLVGLVLLALAAALAAPQQRGQIPKLSIKRKRPE